MLHLLYRIAAKYLSKYSTSNVLKPGCLFSSTCHSRTAKGADLISEGASARLPVDGLLKSILKKPAGQDDQKVPELPKSRPPDLPARVPELKPEETTIRSEQPVSPLKRDSDKAGDNAKAVERKRISVQVSALAPPTVPFGHVGGSSRRGYTIAKNKYEKLRDECLAAGKLFEDRDFPAIDENVFYTPRFRRKFEWKRPHELVAAPKFIQDGAHRFDIVQGELGDCWLLAAIADLTLNDALLTRVVPIEQGFTKAEKYCGIFYFRFWRHGQWVEVFVDDRLSTVNGRLVFMQSKDSNEFWSALLEKAYAKVNGSYENLKGGTASEAMEDFTGGLAEYYEFNQAPEHLFQMLLKSFQLGSMMSVSLDAPPGRLEARLKNGLVMGHAYSVTDIQEIDIGSVRQAKVPCFRLRNPWGASEWNGPFSDGSPEWKSVPENVRKKLGVTIAEDGEFWMAFDDIKKNFTKIEICNLGPETMVAADPKYSRDHPVRWEASVFSGSWTKGITAGGCRNYLDTFHLNPQYRISLREVDGPDGLAVCIIALMQKDRRKLRSRGMDFLTIGFSIYKFPDDKNVPTPLNREFFRYNTSVARSPSFINSREVTTRFRLPPGDYCVIPSTFDPHEEGDFLVRVYSQVPVVMTEYDNANPATAIASTEPQEEAPLSPADEKRLISMTALFMKIAGDDEEITASELGAILEKGLATDFEFSGFSPETIRSMLTMADVDFSGRLGLDEFKSLWRTIKQWRDTFAAFDKKKEGRIRLENLREAITAAGYLVNAHVLRVIALRYGQSDGTIKFEDFILCIVRLQRMIGIFESKDELKLKSAIFSFDDWMLTTMYT